MPVGRQLTVVTPESRCFGNWSRALQLCVAMFLVLGSLGSGIGPVGPAPVRASHGAIKMPFAAGAEWYISQGYNTSPDEGWSHYNCDPRTLQDEISGTESCEAGWQYKYSFDLRRTDGSEAGQPVLSPVDGTIRWIDNYHGGMSIDLGDGYAVAFFHANLVRGLESGQPVRQGQRLGTVAGPGDGANGGTPHIHLTLWKTEDAGNWSRTAIPFTYNYALDGYDFPALGERNRNQHWNTVVASTNGQSTPSTPPPVAPVLTRPATGTVFTDDRDQPMLTWDPVTDASEYQVFINGGERTSPWLADTSWEVGRLTNGDYTWQVRARNDAGRSELSETAAFTIDVPADDPEPTKAPPEPTATPEAPAATPTKEPEPTATPTEPAATATLNLAAASANVGTLLTINGAGFTPGETVGLHWDSADAAPLAETTANETGAWTATFPVPEAAAGSHQILARGEKNRRQASASFEVAPAITRDPVSGTPGSAIDIQVTGFGADEPVLLLWQNETGPTLGTANTDANGSGAMTISIPKESSGLNDLAAVGQSSGARAAASIRVDAIADSDVTPVGTGGPVGEVVQGGAMLGPSTFQVTATVEGLIGGTTSSGHLIEPDDRFVSLPICTTTSCPWLEPGVYDPMWGTRVECGDNCYVRVANPTTGQCAVAPVLETGPWFTLDDWWNPVDSRNVNNLPTTVNRLAQGYPAATAARDGLDVGFGRSANAIGFSNKGYEVGNPSAMDLANGTWQDIGYDLNVGIGPVVVTILWQTGERPEAAAAGCTPATPATPEAESSPEPSPTEVAAPATAPDATPPPVAESEPVDATPDDVADAEPTLISEAATPEATDDTSEDIDEDDAAALAARDMAVDRANALRERYGLEAVPVGAPVVGGGDLPLVEESDSGETERAPELESNADPVADEPVVDETTLAEEPAPVPSDPATAAEQPAVSDKEAAWLAEQDSVPTETPSEAAVPAPVEGTDAAVVEPSAETVAPEPAADVAAEPAPEPVVDPAPAEADVTQPVEPAPALEPAPVAAPAPTDLVFLPVADTSVTAVDPGAPQAPEQIGLLPFGGESSAAAYVTFQVAGVVPGTVVSAQLVLTGAGETAGTGGVVGTLPGVWIDEATMTRQTAPAYGNTPAYTAAGAPAIADWLQPGVETVVDVTGTIAADGTMTFVFFGVPETLTAFGSRESGTPARLIVTALDATGG